jgi:hypothetical protein
MPLAPERITRYNKYTFTIPHHVAMKFEYDPEKSAQNQRKHGIDFEEA